jgi:hypothetical protein
MSIFDSAVRRLPPFSPNGTRTVDHEEEATAADMGSLRDDYRRFLHMLSTSRCRLICFNQRQALVLTSEPGLVRVAVGGNFCVL